MIGQTFGRMTVLERVLPNQNSKILWRCRCQCGTIKIVTGSALRSGNTKSCGCYRLSLMAVSNLRHGMTGKKTHNIWNEIFRRCENPNCDAFPNYGGRGIKVCARWRKFENFLSDMGECPGPEYSIERKRVNGNYEKRNCVWLLRSRQVHNRRNTIRLDGIPLADICEQRGLRYGLVYDRIKRLGWSAERALSVGRL